MASLVLGSWLLGEHTPNALVLLAVITTQGMMFAILVIANRRERARAQGPRG